MPSKKEKLKLREIFLAAFVKEVLRNAYKPEKRTEEVLQAKRFTMPKTPSMIHSVKKPPQPKPLEMPLPPPPTKTPQQTINLGKITKFLMDPSVFAVECPGVGKHLLINRSGVIQTSSVTLNKEEIETLMREISQATRIPLATGLFKAAFQDLVITAILSDFIETKFMIQKRTPFQKFQ